MIQRALLLAPLLSPAAPAAIADDDTPGHQADLHFGPMIGGQDIVFDLRTSVPGSLAYVFLGTGNAPLIPANPLIPVIGPTPPGFTVLPTDANGHLRVEIATQPGQFPAQTGVAIFFQAAVVLPTGKLAGSKVKATEIEPAPPVPGFLTDQAASLLPPGFDTLGASEVAAIDYNRDGWVDLVLNSDNDLHLWTNDGTGAFNDDSVNVPFPGDPIANLTVGDLDDDGDPDIVTAGSWDGVVGAIDRLWLNDGAGVFTEDAAFPDGVGLTFDIELGDVDQDGDLDMALAIQPDEIPGAQGTDQIYINTGGSFSADAAYAALATNDDQTNSRAVQFGDVDTNGTLDLYVGKSDSTGLVGGIGQRNRLFFNDGAGTFTDVTDTNILHTWSDNSEDAELVDIDGDGDLDILVSNSLFGVQVDVSGDVMINLGGLQGGTEGVFADNPASFLDFSDPATNIRFGVEAADIDADGDKDVLVMVHDAVIPGGDPQQLLFINDGGSQGGVEGAYIQAAWFDPVNAISNGAALFDADNDGDLEILITANGVVFSDPSQAFRVRLMQNAQL